MKEKAPASETRQRDGNSARSSLIRAAGIALIVVIIIVAVAFVISGKGRSAANENKAAASDKDLLYEISAESVLDMQTVSGNIVILKKSSVLYLDEMGRTIAELEHSYANPVMLTAGKFLLLYEKGGNELRVEMDAKVCHTVTTQSPITCADLNGKGMFAYVLNSDGGYQSHLYAYTYKGDKKFEWGSGSDEYVMNMKLAAGSKHIMINVLRFSNASHVSVLYLFRISEREPIYTAEFSGETVYAMNLARTDRAIAFTDGGVYRIDQKGQTEELKPHAQNELASLYTRPSGVSALLLNRYGNQNTPELTVYDARFKHTQTALFNGAASCVCASTDFAAAICADDLFICPTKGQCRLVEIGEKCFKIAASRNTVYVLLANGVRSYSANQGVAADLSPENP